MSFSNSSPTISPQKLAKYYSESLVTLCTSYNEPFGLAAIESMACKTPVLAVNEGGYKETVVNNKTGWLLPRDPKQFAQKIIYLQKNINVMEKMGRTGRSHVLQNFTWAKHNSIVESALCRLASQ
ncbi:glycosyltransferase [Candidatus Amesbacteria bacterium]|nr:glycosyltransferase [Candidatus Amesbacteria bacterium]